MRKPSNLVSAKAGERGFSLIELIAVMGIIMVMAAVSLPAISRYIRNYKIRAATQEVAGELQSARSKAIMRNVNAGVTFVIVDSDSYRFIYEDPPAGAPANERFGPLRELPTGIQFDGDRTTTAIEFGVEQTMRFNRLGAACRPGTAPCAAAFPAPYCAPTEIAARCQNQAGPYLVPVPGTGEIDIFLQETATNISRRIRVSPGGRATPDP
jgi:prepilin-type N-terminal cleavage/methylation domain-containing protein